MYVKAALFFVMVSSRLLFADNTCAPISILAPTTCPSGCLVPTSGQDLTINANELYCVPANSSVTVQNVNLNGGSLKVCGNITLNTLNTNGLGSKSIEVASNATVTVNQSMNLSATEVTNYGLIEIKGNSLNINNEGNLFINTTSGKLDMTNASGAEMIVNAGPANASNQYYNFGKTFLQTLRVNDTNNNSPRICLNNSNANYKFCVRKGMVLNPKTPFQVINGTVAHPNVNIMDTTGAHDVQNFYNNNSVTQKLFNSQNSYSGQWVYYQGSTTNPAIALPGHPNYTPSLYENITATNSNAVLDCDGSPLPITLLSFSGEMINANDVELKWATATELNNDKFVIQRSLDGKLFQDLGQISGNNTTIERSDYTYLDINVPTAANLYYRLLQVDFDGKSTKSSIINIKRDISKSDIKIYPTMIDKNQSQITIDAQISASGTIEALIQIISISGQIVQSAQLKLSTGTTTLELENQITPGVYSVQIRSQDSKLLSSHKIVVQ